MAGFTASRPGHSVKPTEPAPISSAACYEELKIYLQSDVWASRLREDGIPYMLVSYERLVERLGVIVGFIGSTAPPDTVADLVERPVTLKLPEIPADDIIANVAELDPLFERFERLRAHLLGDAIAAEYRSIPSN